MSVELGIDILGTFTVKLIGAVEEGSSFNNVSGLLTIRKDNILTLSIEALGFEPQEWCFYYEST